MVGAFAPKMEIRHRQLMDNIRKYKAKFEELGLLPFQTEARLDNQHGGGDGTCRSVSSRYFGIAH